MWDSGWDKLFSRVEWGKYPPEDLIRFIARTFYSQKNRAAIKILEIGCGTGANLWYLAREGFSVYGIDGSSVAISKAKDRLDKESLAHNLLIGDVTQIPYSENYFDAVIDIECIYANNLCDSHKIIEEVYRVLRPNGWFYSKTFMTKMTGSDSGRSIKDEPNTFLEIKDSPLHNDYGLIRLTSEEEIPELYGKFNQLAWDYQYRSDKNRKYIIGEWLIQCCKSN